MAREPSTAPVEVAEEVRRALGPARVERAVEHLRAGDAPCIGCRGGIGPVAAAALVVFGAEGGGVVSFAHSGCFASGVYEAMSPDGAAMLRAHVLRRSGDVQAMALLRRGPSPRAIVVVEPGAPLVARRPDTADVQTVHLGGLMDRGFELLAAPVFPHVPTRLAGGTVRRHGDGLLVGSPWLPVYEGAINPPPGWWAALDMDRGCMVLVTAGPLWDPRDRAGYVARIEHAAAEGNVVGAVVSLAGEGRPSGGRRWSSAQRLRRSGGQVERRVP